MIGKEEKSIVLGSRLETCAGFVRKGGIVADIGTDHAYLPISLVLRGIAAMAYASDINEEPIRSAQRNISSYRLNEKIITFTADGLEKIPSDKVDDIIVAGMGGDNIASIIDRAKWLKNDRYRLILQPMSRASRLREYLFKNGFCIIAEKAVREANRIYTVIYAKYSEIDIEYDDYDIYAGRLEGSDPYAAALLKKQAGILLSAGEGCVAKGDISGSEYYKKLAQRLLINSDGGNSNDQR